MRCIQCKKKLKEKGYWCTIVCKKDFYKEQYMGSNLVKLIEDVRKQEVEEYKESEKYKKFMKRVGEVGFCKALEETMG